MTCRVKTWTRNHELVALAALLLGAWLAVPAGAAAGEKKEKPDYKPFDEVTKGYEKLDGFLPLYYEKKTDRLLAVIPQSMIGTDFLIAESITSGGRLTGYQFGHMVVRWEEFNKKLILVEPETRHFRKESTMKDVIERTYTDSVLLSTPIITKRGNDPVIDMNAVFKQDISGLGPFFGGRMDASISKWSKKKVFPDNIEIAVDAVYNGKGKGGKKATIHYSISRLPKTSYKPREADDRIGYFLQARKDWSADHNDKTVFRRYINRWHLRKSDPSEEVSDVHPDDQIVFYIEKTVPVKYRRYIREGILLWNKAFEKAGIRNVMAVRQQTETNEFAHLDPEDVRYNFFRWIVSGSSFAMGPSRANPLTGQILDADIIMDDSMVRVWGDRYDHMIVQGPATNEDPKLRAFLEAHDEWKFADTRSTCMPSMCKHETENSGWEPAMMKALKDRFPHWVKCSFANEMAHEMALGAAFSAAVAGENPREEFIGQWVKLIACHEVGHTLGLRHNFKASSWKSLEEILANNDPDVPTTASVMDYTPAVYNLDRSDRDLYLTQCVGPYDDLAIGYGYSVPLPKQDEKEMLESIAKSVAEKGLDYATDQDRSFLAPDPLVNVYDHSDDPVAWAKYKMKLVDALRTDLETWAVEDGESYDRLRRTFSMFLFEYSRVIQYATRVVGGQYFHRDHKGDPNGRSPVEIVPVEKQRETLNFLAERVFSDKAFTFSPQLLNKLAPGRWHHWGSDASDFQQEYPIHDQISAVQFWALFHLTNPITIGRVHDAELKVPADQDALTVPELIAKVTNLVWSELDQQAGDTVYTNRKPRISSVRRSLQRNHLQLLTRIVLSKPGQLFPADAVAVTRLTLTGLGEKLQNCAGNKKLDIASRAHMLDSAAQIKKALDAEYEL